MYIFFINFQIMEFKHKDRMSEAEQYVIQLQDIANKLDDFNEEVRMRI